MIFGMKLICIDVFVQCSMLIDTEKSRKPTDLNVRKKEWIISY